MEKTITIKHGITAKSIFRKYFGNSKVTEFKSLAVYNPIILDFLDRSLKMTLNIITDKKGKLMTEIIADETFNTLKNHKLTEKEKLINIISSMLSHIFIVYFKRVSIVGEEEKSWDCFDKSLYDWIEEQSIYKNNNEIAIKVVDVFTLFDAEGSDAKKALKKRIILEILLARLLNRNEFDTLQTVIEDIINTSEKKTKELWGI